VNKTAAAVEQITNYILLHAYSLTTAAHSCARTNRLFTKHFVYFQSAPIVVVGQNFWTVKINIMRWKFYYIFTHVALSWGACGFINSNLRLRIVWLIWTYHKTGKLVNYTSAVKEGLRILVFEVMSYCWSWMYNYQFEMKFIKESINFLSAIANEWKQKECTPEFCCCVISYFSTCTFLLKNLLIWFCVTRCVYLIW